MTIELIITLHVLYEKAKQEKCQMLAKCLHSWNLDPIHFSILRHKHCNERFVCDPPMANLCNVFPEGYVFIDDQRGHVC